MSNVLTMIMAGGEGFRLKPLTSVRTKPAVPFGGNYRIIDFVLSNFVNSGFLKIFVLTQFKSHSLMQHLREGWEHGPCEEVAGTDDFQRCRGGHRQPQHLAQPHRPNA